jgi:glycosyltransferase involved in cell wall biosynthesis
MRHCHAGAAGAGLDAATLTTLSPLRIVNAMLGRGLGGLEQALLDHNDALSRLGHEVHAVIHPEAAVRPALQARGMVWHGLAHLGAWDLIAAMRLRLLLRRLRPDVCIAHGNRAMGLLRHAGAPGLIAVLPNYAMKCDGAAAVFYPTLDLKRHAQGRGVPESRLYHIPSMVRVPPSPPARDPRTPPVVGATGRFVAKKGFEVFIAALGRLRARGVGFRAVLAGDGPERAALVQLAADRGLQDVLTFPGWVNDKAEFFAGIDLFCMPSHHEPFGIVLIEAMAQATPVVATASEGPSEIIHDGLDGILVPRGDADRLTQALGELIDDPERAARLGVNAYRHARDTFDLPRVGAQIDVAVRRVAEQLEVTA